MNISNFKIILKYLTGGIGGVVDYILDILNAALAALDHSDKSKVMAILNIAQKVLATLNALKWLCPTKWQIAYSETIEAVEAIPDALSDLALTAEELQKIRKEFTEAVNSWKSPDDETCVDCSLLSKVADEQQKESAK